MSQVKAGVQLNRTSCARGNTLVFPLAMLEHVGSREANRAELM